MMLTNYRRIIKSGFVNFWRNGFVSLTSVLVMTITLFVVGSLIFIGAIFDASLAQIKDKVDVNVYFVVDAAEEDILSLQKILEGLPEVETVLYTSREEALEKFRKRHENDQLTLQALEELEENPLGASLSIKAKETSQYGSIATFLSSGDTFVGGTGEPIIDKVNFFQNKAAIDKLTQIIDSSERFGFVITVILVLASVLITFNTIRLVIYTSREEISVMRLVGASNSYIRGPFVVEGLMYGFISALITLSIFYPITLWLGPASESFFGNINIFDYYMSNFLRVFLFIAASGMILGALSSWLAVIRYLKA